MAVCLLICAAAPALAQQSAADLKQMSLEDLLNVPVTTVSRVSQATVDVPAAVFVITQEDIRRSGARSLPEVLRLAPGVQVARISAGTYAIGIRGFADRLARSVLVLIDGRAVYDPLFAGTYWEVQNVVLEDVDRIEVIRGPGGTLWGANAVNGIINIITKKAADTQGTYVTAGGGSENRAFSTARYGGHSGNVDYRAYGMAFDRSSEVHPDGNDYDSWRDTQGGFRADWTLANRRAFTLQGDIYDGRLGEQQSLSSFTRPFVQTSNVSAPLSGGNVLARWSGPMGAGSDFQLQTYYDRTNRQELPVGEQRDTGDVDFQQNVHKWARHNFTWGGEYRVTSGLISAVGTSAFYPPRRTDNLYTTFAQEDYALVPNRWHVMIGSKFEHNDYSGFELQPSARALWTPDKVNTVWLAATRAVRTPSRVETDYTTASFVTAAPLPTFVRLLPDPNFVPEKLTAYEAGYRARPASTLYLTASAFYNHLEDLLSTELMPAVVQGVPPMLILPVDFGNGVDGDSYGVELTADERLAPWWRLTANYSYLDVAARKDPTSHDVSQVKNYNELAPHHQLEARSMIDLPRRWAVDWTLRHVSGLALGPIPGYTTWDGRVAWQTATGVEIALVGQDLGQATHLEWASGAGTNVLVSRSVYAEVTFRR